MTDLHYNIETGHDGGGEEMYCFWWETEPPTEPGWYWVKEIINGEVARSVKWFTYSPNDSKITHWLGPLPEPELPE